MTIAFSALSSGLMAFVGVRVALARHEAKIQNHDEKLKELDERINRLEQPYFNR